MEKKAICLLTRILRSHGISSCSAEIFRLAKHNQSEAVVPMWNLLKDMIEYIFYQNRKKIFTELCNDIPTYHHHQHDDTLPPRLVLFVQYEFYKLGYMSSDFYQLSQDDGSSGSRDLLLAFAWIMCHVNFVGLLLKRMSFPGQIASKSTVCDVPMNDGVAGTIPPTWNIIDCVKHMTLIHGKVTLTCQHLHALRREQYRLAHKLHISTEGMSLQPGLNHLTPAEARLLRMNEEKLVSQLENINSGIEDILKWKESENSFWKWMESVVMLKVADSEKVLCDVQNGPEEDKITDSASLGLGITANEKLSLQEAKKKLNETIIQYGLYINNLERVWPKKQPTLSSKEHNKIILDFHTKIKELEAPNIENSSQKKFPIVHQSGNQHNYCLDFLKSQVSKIATAENNSRKLIQKKNLVKEDIVYVNEKTLGTQRKLEIELDSISNEFQNLICIPVSN